MTPTPDRTGKTGSEALARAVRERRNELGLTRQELADTTGIPYSTIAQIETAYRGVSPVRLGVIARVLGLDPKELYEMLAADGAPTPDPSGAAGPTEAADRTKAARPTEAAGPPPGPMAPEVVDRAMPAAAAVPGDAHAARAGAPWHANPRFAAARPAPAAPTSKVPASRRFGAQVTQPESAGLRTPRVVDEVVGLLAGLPVEQRLPALGEVQQRILEQTVEERMARGE